MRRHTLILIEKFNTLMSIRILNLFFLTQKFNAQVQPLSVGMAFPTERLVARYPLSKWYKLMKYSLTMRCWHLLQRIMQLQRKALQRHLNIPSPSLFWHGNPPRISKALWMRFMLIWMWLKTRSSISASLSPQRLPWFTECGATILSAVMRSWAPWKFALFAQKSNN